MHFVEGCWKGTSQGISPKSGHLIPFLSFLIASLWNSYWRVQRGLVYCVFPTQLLQEMIEGWLRRKHSVRGRALLPLPGKGTGIQPNPGVINSWSGSSPCVKFSHHLNSSNGELIQPGRCKRRVWVRPEVTALCSVGHVVGGDGSLCGTNKFLEAALRLALRRRKKVMTESGACQSRSSIFQVFSPVKRSRQLEL